MRIHYLQHVPFEDIGMITQWAKQKNYPVSRSQLFRTQWFPRFEDFDLLVIMGGPMNIYEEKKYPFLKPEKKFIEAALKKGKKIIGICLGAQLLCDVLGGKVRKNKYREIGWLPVSLTLGKATAGIKPVLPKKFMAFYWHGDMFSTPAGSVRIAESQGCRNQAFIYEESVLGLQFHLEITRPGIQRLIRHCGAGLHPDECIQTPEQMLAQHEYLKNANSLMQKILRALERM